ncbi:MAG TPA: T9SS type A sorting domain-containing protein, partial [Chitinophagaceae bacterium]
SFTARRMNGSNAQLKWETATEINNRGFVLQRNAGGNKWQDVVFISSQAEGGNSSSPLVYSYNDMNVGRTIVQYRIQQIDMDGKTRLSEIRTVRADGQSLGMIVYPNPSSDGRINIVFPDRAGIRDATLSDMSGRVLNRWTITNGNTIQVSNLQTGVYYVRTISLETRETSVEKIVITGHK